MSLDDLKGAPDNGKDIFNLMIQTDGFGACVNFARRKIKGNEKRKDLIIEDFNKDEIETLFLPVTVDPGRTTVFTATISHSEDKKEFRSCTSKERQNFAGTDRRKKKVENFKVIAGIKTMESKIPAAKTINIARITEHIQIN